MASRSKVMIIIVTIFSALFVNLPAQANARHAPKISIKAVNAALEPVRHESRSMQAFLGQAIKSRPEASHALNSCVTNFRDTIIQLTVRDGDLQRGEASYNVHVALDIVESCETGLAGEKVNIREVSDRIRKWKGLFNAAYNVVLQAENL